MNWIPALLATLATILVGGIVTVIGLYALGNTIKKQAQKSPKRFFAPIPKPGSFGFIALEGKIEGILENVGGWHLAPQPSLGGGLCFVLGERKSPEHPIQKILQEKLGVIWIGLYATIRIIKSWRWTEFRQTESDGKPTFEVVSREEDVDNFFFQFQYPVEIKDVEIAGNIRVDVRVVFIVLHLFPVRAFFLNKDPVAIFNAMTQGLIRRFIRNMEFNSVKGLSADKNSGDTSLWEEIDKLNGLQMGDDGQPLYQTADTNGLFGKLGHYIARGEVVQVGGVGEIAQAIEAAEVAKLKGLADVVTAEKEADAARARAQGEADALDKKRAARERWVDGTIVIPTGGVGPHVAQVLVAEEIAKSKVIALGGQPILQLPPPPPPEEKK